MNVPRLSFPLVLSAALVLGGCHSSSPNQANDQSQNPSDQTAANAPASGSNAPARPARREPPPPQVIELPAGTEIRVRLDQSLSSNGSRAGDNFPATVADDVVVNGTVVIPKESRADGTVIDAKGLGKFKGGALLAIQLNRVHTRWGSYPVETGSISRAEQGKGKRSAAMIGGGAGLGALIGGLAGGGKGAAIGALAGGGAGTAGSAFTGNKQIVLPAETLLTFRLQNGVRITESGKAEREQSADPQLQTR